MLLRRIFPRGTFFSPCWWYTWKNGCGLLATSCASYVTAGRQTPLYCVSTSRLLFFFFFFLSRTEGREQPEDCCVLSSYVYYVPTSLLLSMPPPSPPPRRAGEPVPQFNKSSKSSHRTTSEEAGPFTFYLLLVRTVHSRGRLLYYATSSQSSRARRIYVYTIFRVCV